MELKVVELFELAKSTEKILTLKQRTAENIIEIGRELIWVKGNLKHGEWLRWLEEEVNLNQSTAWRFMAVAKKPSLLDSRSLGYVGRKLLNFNNFDFQPRLYNVWNFSACDGRFGQDDYPGRIPGQIVQNVLHYYTSEGDLVLDPMAGSGTTKDVCDLMGRRCLSCDLNPVQNKGIRRWDAGRGLPPSASGCDLIFLDPPYWRLKKDNYEGGVASETYGGWLAFMKRLAKDCHQTVKDSGYVALLLEAFLDERVMGRFLDLPFLCLLIFIRAGFKEVQRISVPMPSQVKSVQDVEYAKAKRILLDLNRDLFIFQKR